ncbi:MAG TPA: Rieske 2Fe-2S domain-containing protein [Myxococcota bacterium]|nr:Rieske 2Fe-2S domain-containing protein [Myxococcota bacterium]
MSRFPFGLPFGWYPVAWSRELAVGEALARRYFARDLLLFRGESGEAHVLDAYCPHLGAHLGVGGRVVGDTIQCPFHGWRFGGDGDCVEVPYAKRRPQAARVGAYPTRESAGVLWAWYHPERVEPAFEPPEIAEFGAPDWTPEWTAYDWTVKTHPQEVAENSVDWPHFHEVHLMDPPPERDVRFVGHEILWEAATRKSVTTLDGASDEIRVIGRNPGLGSSYVRYTGMGETVIVMGMTPIDEASLHMRFGVIGKRDGRSEEEMTRFHQAYADDMAAAVEQDFPIWENKAYLPQPRLCDGDGPVPEFRRWAAQFYVPESSQAR